MKDQRVTRAKPGVIVSTRIEDDGHGETIICRRDPEESIGFKINVVRTDTEEEAWEAHRTCLLVYGPTWDYLRHMAQEVVNQWKSSWREITRVFRDHDDDGDPRNYAPAV